MIIWLVRTLCSFLRSCHLCFCYLLPFKELSQVASAANNKLPSDFLLAWLGAPENEWNQSPMLLEFMKTAQPKKLQSCLVKNRRLRLPGLCVKQDIWPLCEAFLVRPWFEGQKDINLLEALFKNLILFPTQTPNIITLIF